MSRDLENIDDMIAKVLAGEASREEIDLLEGWLDESSENRVYFEETKKLFAQIDNFKIEHNVDSLKAWNKLNARIEADEKQEAKELPLFRRSAFIRVAASILLVATLALVVNYFLDNNQPTPVLLAAHQKVVEQSLPDGSKVTINKNSEIAYVQNGKKREVKLKGEAYFEVVHNEEFPFEITIDDVIIKDIGTAFNVKALPESKTVEVLVESGEVHFYTSTNKGLNLIKGEKAIYDKTTKRFSKVVPDPVENTVSYKSKVFHFNGTTLREVISQLNNVYGSNITLEDERLGKCRLTVMFNDESLDGVLGMITETLDLDYSRSGEKIILKGEPCVE